MTRSVVTLTGALVLASWGAAAVTGATQAPAAGGPSTSDGVYTAEQAEAGKTAFAEKCASCHEPGKFTGAEFTRAYVGRPLVYFQLYPNPVADLLNLHYTGDILSNTEIFVADVAGRTVLRQSLTQEQQLLDVSRLQAGLYVLSLMEGEKRVATERFVKM